LYAAPLRYHPPMTSRWPIALLMLLVFLTPVRGDDSLLPEDLPPPDPWLNTTPLPTSAYDALDVALAAQNLTQHDLSFQKDPVPDDYRFTSVSQVLHQPMTGYDTTWEYGHVFDSDTAVEDLLQPDNWKFLTRELDLTEVESPLPLPDVNQLSEQLGMQFEVLRVVHQLAFHEARFVDDGDFIAALPGLVTEDDQSGPYADDELAGHALQLWTDVRDSLAGEPWVTYLRESVRLAALTERFAATLETISARPSPFLTDFTAALRASGWNVIEGTDGDDHHVVKEGDVIVDLMGNDTYTFEPGLGFASPIGHWILDLSGDDTYRGTAPGAAGGAIGQTSILLDQSGDDVYRTGAVSQGAAIFGVGMRLDRGAGRDFYDGGDFTQGAAMFGIALSDDAGGDDSYNATLYGQGAALTGGLGLCLDHEGDDRYYAGGKHQDYPRWPEHWLSLSQGCAFGLRPTASGGIAFLGDFSGNDFYESEVFGQGVGYWYAMGMLLDKEGHDWYQCLQYGQGAGIHLAVGTLIDVAGIDHYNGWADLQGCGHDLGVGLFLEVQGRDYMTANDLSQGAGNANAVGIAIDLAGDDAWLVRNPDNNQGYGNARRDFGSIGVMLDLQGKDEYSIEGHADGKMWTSSRWGVGYDTDAPPELSPVKFISVSGTSGATR